MTNTRTRIALILWLMSAAIVAVPAQNQPARATTPAVANSNAAARSQPSPASNTGENPFTNAAAPNGQPVEAQPSELMQTFQIITRLFLAVLLSGILAFRPRKNVPLFRRSLFVSQTQILLAVVAAALMLIVDGRYILCGLMCGYSIGM